MSSRVRAQADWETSPDLAFVFLRPTMKVEMVLHPFPHLGLLLDLRRFSAEILLSYYIALVS